MTWTIFWSFLVMLIISYGTWFALELYFKDKE